MPKLVGLRTQGRLALQSKPNANQRQPNANQYKANANQTPIIRKQVPTNANSHHSFTTLAIAHVPDSAPQLARAQ
jgi:hypothetical protein